MLVCLRGRLSHSLVALENRLLIVKPGFHAGTTFGSLVTTFYYQDVTAIQLNTFLVTGWIEVSSPSFPRRDQGVDPYAKSADHDVYRMPNAIPISKRRVPEYLHALAQLRGRIEFCKQYGRAPAEPPPLLGSLERIADLRRSGAITDPEYARLKRALVNTVVDAAADGQS